MICLQSVFARTSSLQDRPEPGLKAGRDPMNFRTTVSADAFVSNSIDESCQQPFTTQVVKYEEPNAIIYVVALLYMKERAVNYASF